MSSRPGDTGYDHNIPHLHRAFERMSLDETNPKPQSRPPPTFGQMVTISRVAGLPPRYKTAGKKTRKIHVNKKRYSRRINKRFMKTR